MISGIWRQSEYNSMSIGSAYYYKRTSEIGADNGRGIYLIKQNRSVGIRIAGSWHIPRFEPSTRGREVALAPAVVACPELQ